MSLSVHATMQPITMEIMYRPGSLADLRQIHRVFRNAIVDLSYRLGTSESNQRPDDQALQQNWERYGSLFGHLLETASDFWVAEWNGEIVGYARAIRRGAMHELTDFFVLPEAQGAGVGRELLHRTFRAEDATHRSIIATLDVQAQARYLKIGVSPRFPIYTLSKAPQITSYTPTLTAQTVTGDDQPLELLASVDLDILGYRRDQDHRWLLTNRTCYLYYRDSQLAGYGYVGEFSGPFALHDPRDFGEALAHAESESARRGYESFDLDLPGVNQAAIQHLLSHGFRISPFFCLLMTDGEFGRFDRYIGISPMFLI